VLEVAIGGIYVRVADPDWQDPLDASFAARPPGQRWNPPGLACLYVNGDRGTARANVARLFASLPYGPEDLDPVTAPLLIEVAIPEGTAADAYTEPGLAALGLPGSYPVDSAESTIAHAVCQPIGWAAAQAGLDGVDARSAAPTGDRELAWFPRGRGAFAQATFPFEEWWYL
jgi:RES domain